MILNLYNTRGSAEVQIAGSTPRISDSVLRREAQASAFLTSSKVCWSEATLRTTGIANCLLRCVDSRAPLKLVFSDLQ